MILRIQNLKTATIALAGAALMMGAPAAKAQNVLDNFLQEMGLQSKKRAAIDYRERPPLVLPKSVDGNLPPPQQAAADPSWPVDPDVQAEIDAEAQRPSQRQQLRSQEDLRISRQELARGRVAYGDAQARVTRSDENVVMTPEQLQAVRESGQQAAAAGFVEPERRRLTDPPVGYRTPAASAAYESGENLEAPRTGRLTERINPWQQTR